MSVESLNVSVQDQPLPRYLRQGRKKRCDRGLPPDHELLRLAGEYLKRQRQHWPNLASAGLLPDGNDKTLTEMVEDFKSRHRTGEIRPDALAAFNGLAKLGGNYNRYSCDNSQPTSIIDQLSNALVKAKAEERFVPWEYVFCDYAVTGLDSSRQGYSSYKKILADPNQRIETTYVDDFTRASRDEIEWWKLGYISRRLKKRMIGASDSFDLTSANGDVLISIRHVVAALHQRDPREGCAGHARSGR